MTAGDEAPPGLGPSGAGAPPDLVSAGAGASPNLMSIGIRATPGRLTADVGVSLGREPSDDEDVSPEEAACAIPGRVEVGLPMSLVSAGDSHSAAVSEGGRTFLWGSFRVMYC